MRLFHWGRRQRHIIFAQIERGWRQDQTIGRLRRRPNSRNFIDGKALMIGDRAAGAVWLHAHRPFCGPHHWHAADIAGDQLIPPNAHPDEECKRHTRANHMRDAPYRHFVGIVA